MKISDEVKISVIVPCYNQELYIEECLNSILNQTISNWECIIVNDGSTDNSLDKISIFLKDSRYTLINIKNKGVSNARNLGIKKAKGEYILPLDGDDKISNDYLKEALTAFDDDIDTSLVYCKASFFGEKEGHWDLPEYSYEAILQRNHIFCSAIYKKSVFLQGFEYDTNLIHGYEDWDFWLQILNEKSKVVRLNKTHFYYRQRENSRDDFTNDFKKLRETENYIFNKHFNKYNIFIDKKTSLDLLREHISFTITFIQKEQENQHHVNLLHQKEQESQHHVNLLHQKEQENHYHVNLLHQKEQENQHHINLLHQKEQENQYHVDLLHEKEREFRVRIKKITRTISYHLFLKVEVFIKERLRHIFKSS